MLLLDRFLNLLQNNHFLKLVKDITSKGFVRSNYEKKLIDLTDVKINLKSKILAEISTGIYETARFLRYANSRGKNEF